MHPAQTDTTGSIAGCGGNLNEPADSPKGEAPSSPARKGIAHGIAQTC